jgi:glucose/arabinose dehydrogenase
MEFKRRTLLLGAAGALAGCTERARSENTLSVEVLARGLNYPWSLAHLPGGVMLITEKRGGVRIFRNGALAAEPLQGAPQNILNDGDSGLLDIVLDPDFARTRTLFISFTEGTLEANRMALYRARFDGRALLDGRIIYRIPNDKRGSGHSGGRIAFLPDGTLLVTTGEGYDYRDQAQALASRLGKVLRLDREGRPPRDNPFVGRAGVAPEIYTLGHRNPLGLLRDPRDGAVWLHGMGPRGGDEINLLRAGANYGWPRTTYGTDYDGTVISPLLEAPGVTNPALVWNPSISPSGFALYLGDAFPQWRGDFFVGALSGQHLRRVRIRNGVAVLEEMLLHERRQRIRDVRAGPDGFLYLLTDEEDGNLLRIRPAA